MTECPNTQNFHKKMETFVTYTHCMSVHRKNVLDAFEAWKRKRIIDELISERSSTPSDQPIETSSIQPIKVAASQLLPSTPARSIASSDDATSDDDSSFVESISDTRSVTSITTCMTSLPNTPLRNGTTSRFHTKDVAEEERAGEDVLEEDVYFDCNSNEEVVQETVEQDIFEEVITKEEASRDDIIASNVKQERNDNKKKRDSVSAASKNTTAHQGKHNGGKKIDEDGDNDKLVDYNEESKVTVIEGLGIIGIRRTPSLRDHSSVFKVINSHPTPAKMQEGVVYILHHKRNRSLFKIGWSSKSAEERQRQSGNCYGKNTKVFYETKRIVGAPQAERIAQVILQHANIPVSQCVICGGGHREWFSAPRKTIKDTVLQVEKFLQMPAYTLQDGEYKLSPEVYEGVVRQMCDFSVTKFAELIHGSKVKCEEAGTSGDVLIDTKVPPSTQLTLEPVEGSLSNTGGGLSRLLEANKSFVSISSHDTKSQNLSAGAKLMSKVKWLFSISDSVKAYFSDL
jgi:hypothetical protein